MQQPPGGWGPPGWNPQQQWGQQPYPQQQAPQAPEPAAPPWPGRRFQYKQLNFTTETVSEGVLNQLGAQGWELLFYYPVGSTTPPSIRFVFKREMS